MTERRCPAWASLFSSLLSTTFPLLFLVQCYVATLAKDLAPWRETGITEEVFERTRTYNMGTKWNPPNMAKARNIEQGGGGGRMNHYQIIKGRLYGSDRCPSRSGRLTFHPRCEVRPRQAVTQS